MTTNRRTTYPHVVCDPRILDGEPVIRGTAIPVRSIVLLSRYEDIDYPCAAYPAASREAIEEALAYYREHQDEIDRAMEENEALANGWGELVTDGDGDAPSPSRITRDTSSGSIIGSDAWNGCTPALSSSPPTARRPDWQSAPR